MKAKLKFKLIFIVSMVIIVLSFIITTISCVTNYKSSISVINNFIPKVVNSTSQAIENRIGDYLSTIKILSQNHVLTMPNSTSTEKINTLKLIEDNDFMYYGFTDKNGKIFTTNNETPSDTKFFEKSISGQEYFSEPFADASNKNLLGLVSCPIKDNTGNIQGVFFGVFDFSIFCDIVKDTSVSPNTSPTVYNKEGTLMLYGDKQFILDKYNLYTGWLDLLKSDKGIREAYSRALNGGQSLEYLNVDGKKIVFAYAPIENTQWSYNFYVPVSDFMGSFKTSLIVNITSAIIVLILSILIVYVYSNKLTKPIEKIKDRIVKLSYGDLHTDTYIEPSKDELEELSYALSNTTKFLSSCIKDITSKLEAIGNCDLSSKEGMEYKGDFIDIKNAFETISSQLNETFKYINESAEQVSTSAEQVSSVSQTLSQNSSNQASSTQELAAAISEISTQVKNNAEHSENANSKAKSVGEEMTESNQKMLEMIDAMNEISNSSSKIGKIIKTIEDIAFQTNILALNAAVEAARAGEAGKGFAVVAEEVRNLASKSAESSKNTSSLIENSLKAVKNGTNIANETAKSLISAVEGSKDVSNTINKISSASKEQSDSIEQITQGIDQIALAVQTNSATAEEASATSQELASQSQLLKSLLSKFKLKSNIENNTDIFYDKNNM